MASNHSLPPLGKTKIAIHSSQSSLSTPKLKTQVTFENVNIKDTRKSESQHGKSVDQPKITSPKGSVAKDTKLLDTLLAKNLKSKPGTPVKTPPPTTPVKTPVSVGALASKLGGLSLL